MSFVETDAWQWNLSSAGLDRRQYTKAEFDNLLERYECPDSKNRWDSPLFMVQSDEDIDFDSIAKCLLEGRAAKANQSTVMMNNLPSNVMCDIEKITKEVTQKVLSQKGGQQIFTKGVVPQAKLLKSILGIVS
ncbi:protein KTI12 homolog [Neocloeon triangulifer]|uniref:protein KTI12 homolog n=1 Tax=Neocloeon triangulifer TaxID=2078957 RepID=UPI00286EC985|nr:protein KTI12 homolog [Neocloeon triangulifer]